MIYRKLLPPIADLVLEKIEEVDSWLRIHLSTSTLGNNCPLCNVNSTSVHSRYERKISDLSWANYSVLLLLSCRKFYCKNESCDRRIFTERFGDVVKSYARSTVRLIDKVQFIGFLCGGNQGARLLKEVNMKKSASSILRNLHKEERSIEAAPKIIGIDDWAWRKGTRYGTIIVDLELQRPIALLKDREVKTVQKWLSNYPSIEIITRDRAACYAKAASEGAPQAIQVADRWHLLKNLGEAAQKVVHYHNKQISELFKNPITDNKVESESTKDQLVTKAMPSKQEIKFKEVKALQKLGASKRSIHRQTGVHRQTIQKYFNYDNYPAPKQAGVYRSKMLSYHNTLETIVKEGITSRVTILSKLKEQGFTGSITSLNRYLVHFPNLAKVEHLPERKAPFKGWSNRRMSRIICDANVKLKDYEQQYLNTIYENCPKIKLTSELSQRFKTISDELDASELDMWLEDANKTEIKPLIEFAKGIKRDYDAVKAAFTYKWSNGQVEGQVNRLKTIKRQMYGRASYNLLKNRVLAG